LPLFGRAVAFNSLTVAIDLVLVFQKVKGRNRGPLHVTGKPPGVRGP
jgi:hypothetical protein